MTNIGLDIQYFDFEQDTVGFGKNECFSIFAEPADLFESESKLLITYNKHGKKINDWAGISKGEEKKFSFLLRIWLKNYMLA